MTVTNPTTTPSLSPSTRMRIPNKRLIVRRSLEISVFCLVGYFLQLIHLQGHALSDQRLVSALFSSSVTTATGGDETDEYVSLLQQEYQSSSASSSASSPALLKALHEFSSPSDLEGARDGEIIRAMGRDLPPKSRFEYNCTLPGGEEFISLPQIPTFIIIGTQKGGTSALHALMKKHPLLVAPKRFEPHFFDLDPGMKHVNATVLHHMHSQDRDQLVCALRQNYSSNFKLRRLRKFPQMLSFEKTPSYIITKHAPARVQAVAPWAKIIVSLRNPVDRCFSHWKMKVERNQLPANQTFEQHLAMDLEVLRRKHFSHIPDNQPFPEIREIRKMRMKIMWKVKNIVYRGLYAQQLQNWMRHGYRLGENLLVVRYERLKEEPNKVLDEILDFLNVPRHTYKDRQLDKSYSPSRRWGGPRNDLTLKDSSREYLKRLYAPYNEELALLLGKEWEGVWNGTTAY